MKPSVPETEYSIRQTPRMTPSLSESHAAIQWYLLLDQLYELTEHHEPLDFRQPLPKAWQSLFTASAEHFGVAQVTIATVPEFSSDCRSFPIPLGTDAKQFSRALYLHIQCNDNDRVSTKKAAITQFVRHLGRCLDMRSALWKEYNAVQSCYGVLQRLAIPLILFDERRQAMFANQALIRLVERDANLDFEKGEIKLKASNMDPVQALLTLQSDSALQGKTTTVIRQCIDGLWFTLLLLPKVSQSVYAGSNCPSLCLFVEESLPAAMSSQQIQLRMEQEAPFLLSRLRDHYGLTTKEAQLAFGLSLGMSLNRYAESVSRSSETIRTQVKSLFAKTGVNDQKSLLMILWQERLGEWLNYFSSLPDTLLLMPDLNQPNTELGLTSYDRR